jgi:hypothetical protein
MAIDEHDKQLVWRLIDETGQGADVVTLVLPFSPEKPQQAQLLETDVVASQALPSNPLSNHDLSWSQSDIMLLLTLAQKMLDMATAQDPDTDKITLDFENPTVIEIIQIVAAARFAEPFDLTQVNLGPVIHTTHSEIEQGDMVALPSLDGYPLAVITDLDSVECTCVLVEPVELKEGQTFEIHDVVKVSRMDLLPATFGHVFPADEDVIH